MTRLKQAWRELPETERERWEEIFISSQPVAEIRRKLAEELKVNLTSDKQWCRFRDWAEEERVREEMEDRMKEDERHWEEEFGQRGAFEKARKKLLACSYGHAFRHGSYQQGLATLRADCRVQGVEQQGRRVVVLEKRAEAQADPDGYLADCKMSPEERKQRILEAYGRA
jgi:hypothetical protein